MIELKPFNEQDLRIIWAIGFKEEYPEWSKWNSPYFDEYRSYQTFEEFKQSKVFDYLMSDTCRGIFLDSKPIGKVSRYWENKMTRWLEIGIIIYQSNGWSKGIGFMALTQWVTQTFFDFPEVQRVGLTTWSGNQRMMRAAKKIGMTQEACIRKVRYFEGIYYDSVKYGVLRDEWEKHQDSLGSSFKELENFPNIRRAKVKDADAIAELSRVSLGYECNNEEVKSKLTELCTKSNLIILVYVAAESEKVVGFVQAELYQAVYFKDGLNILGLAVLPAYQRRGIGRQLMTVVESLAKANRLSFIRLNSADYRHEAHAFYEGIGYRSNKLQKRFIKEIE